MHGAGYTGKDGAAHLDEVAHSGETALHGRPGGMIALGDFSGNSRNEGVGQKLAMFVGDVDVADSLDFDELVDQGLQG